MKQLKLADIKRALNGINLMYIIEEGFAAYSRGDAVIPPVGELLLDDPPGEVHIKYGYLKKDAYYVIKIASGFYANPELGLPAGNGLVLLFSQQTGEPLALLQDEGYLTDIRTAVAGAVAAKYLAPSQVKRIGLVGTGVQARLQLEYLKAVTDCRDVLVWGRSEAAQDRYRLDMSAAGFVVKKALAPREIAETCNLIVTTTPSKSPLLFAKDIRAGTHITAIGSDTADKQELDPAILKRAQRLIVDSKAQCQRRGESSHALRAHLIAPASLIELGNVIRGKHTGRTNDSQITVADLTGVAVQDIQIASAVYERSS